MYAKPNKKNIQDTIIKSLSESKKVFMEDLKLKEENILFSSISLSGLQIIVESLKIVEEEVNIINPVDYIKKDINLISENDYINSDKITIHGLASTKAAFLHWFYEINK
jgi:hypothetical protein